MNHVGQPPLYLGFIEGSSFCYDATWTLAKALNRTMSGKCILYYYMTLYNRDHLTMCSRKPH